jgi:hypothetical protein
VRRAIHKKLEQQDFGVACAVLCAWPFLTNRKLDFVAFNLLLFHLQHKMHLMSVLSAQFQKNKSVFFHSRFYNTFTRQPYGEGNLFALSHIKAIHEWEKEIPAMAKKQNITPIFTEFRLIPYGWNGKFVFFRE